MGFLSFMSRMLQGKPVFEDKDQSLSGQSPSSVALPEPSQQTKELEGAIDKSDIHSFPTVKIVRVTNHEDSTRVRVYCHFLNTWPKEIMLDKIRLLGTKRELDTFLRGNEEREFLVYDGPKLQKEYHEAVLDYKTVEEGDYFEATFDVKSNYHEADKTYMISEMHLRLPIRDIYG